MVELALEDFPKFEEMSIIDVREEFLTRKGKTNAL
jgi:hypothetical protein